MDPSKQSVEEHVEERVELPPVPTYGRRGVTRAMVSIGAVLAVLLAVGAVPRMVRARQLREDGHESGTSRPRVEVVHPRALDEGGSLTFPGSIEPMRETWIYARAAGYVHDWKVDIGAVVAEDQVLLELDTPELDAELAQAKATLAVAKTGVEQAHANRDLAAATDARYARLGQTGVVSQQEVEERRTQLAVADANTKAAAAAVDSQQANLVRLSDLKSFSKVTAPFAGRITARNVEKGQLVNSGAAGGQGLYRLAQDDTVRVFVHVPQESASLVKPGEDVSITLRERPGQTFIGKVAHTAGALDPASRSLNTEVQIPNADHVLLAGMYARATIQVGAQKNGLRVPIAALRADAHGTRLWIVDGDSHLKAVPVEVGRDFGTEVEIVSGITGAERVAVNVPAGTPEGAVVEAISREKT